MEKLSKRKRRIGGRSLGDLRPIKIRIGVNRYAEGSCEIEMGHTHVLCLASVEEGVPKFKENREEGWVTAEYAMLPRATHTRSDRESKKGKLSGRTQEISRLIGRSLRAVCDFKKLGPRTILLDCEVLQADGGTRCAAITGSYIAFCLALKKLKKERKIKHWPLNDYVAAVSVGMVDGKHFLDLCYEEDSTASVDMNIVATGSGKIVELQGTAEKDPFDEAQLKKMLSLGKMGVRKLIAVQKKALA